MVLIRSFIVAASLVSVAARADHNSSRPLAYAASAVVDEAENVVRTLGQERGPARLIGLAGMTAKEANDVVCALDPQLGEQHGNSCIAASWDESREVDEALQAYAALESYARFDARRLSGRALSALGRLERAVELLRDAVFGGQGDGGFGGQSDGGFGGQSDGGGPQ